MTVPFAANMRKISVLMAWTLFASMVVRMWSDSMQNTMPHHSSRALRLTFTQEWEPRSWPK